MSELGFSLIAEFAGKQAILKEPTRVLYLYNMGMG